MIKTTEFETSQTLLRSICGLQTAKTSNQLTVSYGRPCGNVFTRQTSSALMNCCRWPGHYLHGCGSVV